MSAFDNPFLTGTLRGKVNGASDGTVCSILPSIRRPDRSQRMTLLEILSIDLPIIQAPMAGVSSPAMAAAVSNAGALGSIGVGATDAAGARRMIARSASAPSAPSM